MVTRLSSKKHIALALSHWSRLRRNHLSLLLTENTTSLRRALCDTALASVQYASRSSRSDLPPRHKRPHPPIGGQRISIPYLKSLPEEECMYWFRFTADDLFQLARVLGVPTTIWTPKTECRFSGVEALALLCIRFRTESDLYMLSTKFRRSETALSEIINWMAVFLDEKWSYLLDFDHLGAMHPDRLAEYAEAVHRAGAPVHSVCAFIDCTIRQMAHPTSYQRYAYNGHKKHHALKYQALALPNGLIGDLYGPVEGRHNDLWLLSTSKLVDKLADTAVQPGSQPGDPAHERFLQIYGDGAYIAGDQIMAPFDGGDMMTADEWTWNITMSQYRQSVEHIFGNVVSKWPFLNQVDKMKVFSSPIGSYYRIAVLLTNALNCLKPNQISQFFSCKPPSLEEYFHH